MRLFRILFAIFCLTAAAPIVSAGDGKVIKVLAQLLDRKGRQTIAPSLYERDAYQAYLRTHRDERGALRLAVQWKARDVDWTKLKMRVEMRGVLGNDLHTTTVEEPVKKTGWFSTWSNFEITGDDYKNFGTLVAWRVTLWEGDRQLAQQESFLWSGNITVPK
jgi:hypothetical protein